MQQNTSAMWAAIILLAALAGIFGVVSFNAQQEIQSLTDKLKQAGPDNIASEYNNQKIKDGIRRQLELSQQVETFKEALIQSQRETAAAKRDYDDQRASILRRDETIVKLEKEAKAKETEHQAALRVQMEEYNKKIETLEVELANYKTWNDQRVRENNKLKQDYNELNEATNTIVSASERERQSFTNRIGTLTQRIASAAGDNATEGVSSVEVRRSDGKILLTDIGNNTVQISLGEVDKVRPGMRFLVTRERYNRVDTMGEIEITKVGRTTSEAVILVQSAPLKRDSTGWVTDDPRAKYSPYATALIEETDAQTGLKTGRMVESRDKVEELVPVEHREVSSMNAQDPIMVRDDIHSPLYDPNRVLHFVHIGVPIMLGRDAMQTAIDDSGGVLAGETAEVDSSTDYLIVSKIPTEGDVMDNDAAQEQRKFMLRQMELAREFGVPIMREAEFVKLVRN